MADGPQRSAWGALGANGDRLVLILSVQLTTNRFGNLTRLIRNLLTLHTYYCTCIYSSTEIQMYFMYHECSSRA